MMRLKTANNAGSTLMAAISETDVSFTVADASSFPDVPFRCTIHKGDPAQGEIIEVGAKDGNTFSLIDRGLENTIAAVWEIGDKIDILITSGMCEELVSQDEMEAHIEAERPHQLIDQRDSAVYNYGLKINEDGVLTLVLEEVV